MSRYQSPDYASLETRILARMGLTPADAKRILRPYGDLHAEVAKRVAVRVYRAPRMRSGKIIYTPLGVNNLWGRTGFDEER